MHYVVEHGRVREKEDPVLCSGPSQPDYGCSGRGPGAGQGSRVGRGTESPFEQVGADWIDGRQLAAFLNSRFIPGVRVYPTRFQPNASNFKGRTIDGVRFVITDRNALDSARLGLEVGYALEKLY